MQFAALAKLKTLAINILVNHKSALFLLFVPAAPTMKSKFKTTAGIFDEDNGIKIHYFPNINHSFLH